MTVAILHPTGARAIQMASYALDLSRFFARTWGAMLRAGTAGARVVGQATVKQVYFTGVGAIPVVAGLAFAMGAIIMVQTPSVVSGGGRLVGTLMDLVIVRQLAPLMTAFIVTGRSGAAITVELGNMRVQGEIDTLEAMGIDPVHYLAVPRMVGVTWAMICLCVLFDLVAMLGGFVVAGLAIDTPPSALLAAVAERITLSGIASGLAKSAAYGLAVSVVSAWQGFAVERSVTEVPQATSRCIVHCIVLCVLINLLLTLLGGGVA